MALEGRFWVYGFGRIVWLWVYGLALGVWFGFGCMVWLWAYGLALGVCFWAYVFGPMVLGLWFWAYGFGPMILGAQPCKRGQAKLKSIYPY